MDQKLAAIASAAKGIVSRGELHALGMSDSEIKRRVEKGRLIRVHWGVYRVGHAAPGYEATYLAAVKACGERAVLWGRAAAFNQQLLPLTRNPPTPQVMGPTQRSVAGVRTRRCRNIHPLEVAEYRGIPTTTVPRTLVDLAADSSEDELARAVHEAQVKHGTKPSHVLAVLDRHPRAKGSRRLRRVMTGDSPVLLSNLERGFRKRLKAAKLPLPETNVRVDGRYVDCRWAEPPLTVELDSFQFHSSRYAWEQSYARRRAARARGDEFRQYTWHDVFDEPEPMLDELRRMLG